MSQAVRLEKPSRPGSLASVVTATLCGLVLGVAIDAAAWLWAFGRAVSDDAGIAVPLIVSTTTERGDVVAQTGIGVLVLPLLLALCGAGFGAFFAYRRRQRSGT